jgi:hypothetical protein
MSYRFLGDFDGYTSDVLQLNKLIPMNQFPVLARIARQKQWWDELGLWV